jgi:hypothetical protein
MNRIVVALLVAILALGVFFWLTSQSVYDLPVLDSKIYHSSELELSFNHPSKYDVVFNKDGNGEREWYNLVLIPAEYIPPVGGEGPPSIAVSMYQNTEYIELEEWIRGNNFSNFKLSSDQVLVPTEVNNITALSYSHTGLYETDAVVVAKDNKIYVFSVGWITRQDEIRRLFKDILASVKFD